MGSGVCMLTSTYFFLEHTRVPTNSQTIDAVIYVRISEDKTGLSAGVERQEKECRDLADRLGYRISQVYEDNDISATKGKIRPSFEQLLRDRPSVVIVWHVDRLVRLTKDLERVLDLDCKVHAVQAGDFDLSNASGRMYARTVVNFATYEGELKAERQRASHRQRVRQGKHWWPVRPFGFQVSDGTVSHRPEEAQMLRECYQGVLSGRSLSSLAKEMNDRGFTTTKTNGPWTGPALRVVLLNARNAGIRVYEGEEYGSAAWEPIVDEETYRATVRTLKDPKRGQGSAGRKPSGILTGIGACGSCGGPIRVGTRKDSKGETYRVYTCREKHCLSLRLNAVDDMLLAIISERLYRPDAVSLWHTPKDAGDPSALRDEEQALQKRLTDMAEDYASGNVTRAQFLAATDRARERLEEIAQALADMMAPQAPKDLLNLPSPREVRAAVDSMPLDVVRTVVERMTRSVALLPLGRGRRKVGWHNLIVWFNPSPEGTSEVIWDQGSYSSPTIDSAESIAIIGGQLTSGQPLA